MQTSTQQCTTAQHELQAFKKHYDELQRKEANAPKQCGACLEKQLAIERLEAQLAKAGDKSEQLFASEAMMRELKNRVHEAESARRKLHNKIQELRGNVRVTTRVRPFLPHDDQVRVSVRVRVHACVYP